MIEVGAIKELVDQYAPHKWVLRRVLLSELTLAKFSEEIRIQFPSAETVSSEVEALWFSRKNKASETWELRRLGGPPYALVEVIDDTVPADEREARLALLEAEMAEHKAVSPGNINGEIPSGNL